jgi:hypothetical protein
MLERPMAQDRDCFPDLDSFHYKIVSRTAVAKLVAWCKLEEAERRLTMYKWAEGKNEPGNPRNRVLLNDAVSAFLLTIEATIQFIKNQVPKTRGGRMFDDWLKTLPENDVLLRGLRTLRHFEAHVEPKPLPRVVNLEIEENLSGGDTRTEITTRWVLQELKPGDLIKVTRPLKKVDLPHWNTTVTRMDAPTIFEKGLENLEKILQKAEKEI